MQILGWIMILTGGILFFNSKTVTRSLPPTFEEDEDSSFLQTLRHMELLLKGAAILLLAAGAVFLL